MNLLTLNIDHAIWAGTASGAILYLLGRWLLGKRADAMIGGCVAAGLVFQPWWASASGYLAGHAIALMLVNKFIDKTRPKPFVLVLLGLAVVGPLAGFYLTLGNYLQQSQAATAEALKRYEAGTEADRFVAAHYAPCLEHRVRGLSVHDDGKQLPTTCKASTLTIASKMHGDEFARQVGESMSRWDSDRNGDAAAKARIDKSLKPISG